MYLLVCVFRSTRSLIIHFWLCSHAKRIAGSDLVWVFYDVDLCRSTYKTFESLIFNFFFFVFRIRFSIRCESGIGFSFGFGVQWALINYSSLRKAHWISCVAPTSAKIIYPKTLPVLGNRMNLFLFVIDTNARISTKRNSQLGSHSIQFPNENRTIWGDWYNIGALELISIFNSHFRCVRFVARKHVSYYVPPHHTTPSPLHTQQLQLIFETNTEHIASTSL